MSGHDTRPNILFILSDQHRHDWVGTTSSISVQTPNYDALAGRGVEFRNAVCPAPICGPSRSCIASGLEYPHSGVYTNQDYPLGQSTYYERLRDEANYEVVGVGDVDLHMNSPTWGIKGDYMLEAMGFSDGIEIPGKVAMYRSYQSDLSNFDDSPKGDSGGLPPDISPESEQPADPYIAELEHYGLLEHYIDDMQDRVRIEPRYRYAITRPTPLPQDKYVDDWVGQHAMNHLDDLPMDQPWHLVVNFVGPHSPMDVTGEMFGWYRNPDIDFPKPDQQNSEIDSDTHQEIRRNYSAMVENIDRWIGRFINMIRDRGELDNTLICYASDHGELLGDHNGWGKGSPRQESVGVPLVMAGPDISRRGPVDDPATILDLHATFLDYADLAPGDVDSKSLQPYLAGEFDSTRKAVYSGLDPWRMVFDGRYKLIVGYDQIEDPDIKGDTTAEFADIENRTEKRTRLHDNLEPILFDLEKDPRETVDISGRHPEVVQELSELL